MCRKRTASQCRTTTSVTDARKTRKRLIILRSLQYVHVTNRAHSNHMSQARLRITMLPIPSLSAQLHGNFPDLANPRWADRVPHRNQSSRRIDGAFAANIEGALLEHADSLTHGAKTHGFNILKLLDRERIMKLDQVQILGLKFCLRQG
jgi:hypothetical protein